MKKLPYLPFVIAAAVICLSASFSPVEHGVYAQLVPGSSKKFVIQIVPDKTYADVVVHVNFYSSDNKRVGQKAYSLSDKDKYIRKDQVTSRTFKVTFDDVSRVKIDHVNENEILDDKGESKGGTKINIPVATHALEPVEK